MRGLKIHVTFALAALIILLATVWFGGQNSAAIKNSNGVSKISLQLYSDKDRVNISAKNISVFPVSLDLAIKESPDYEILNSSNNPVTVMPNTEETLYELRTFRPIGPDSLDPFLIEIPGSLQVDTSFVYELPCACDISCRVSQVEGGTHAEWASNAIDFDLPIGSDVFAMRSGEVIEVYEASNRSCQAYSPQCDLYTNKIVVLSSDGALVEYLHLQQSGALVSVGMSVSKFQLIGKSGNTGYSSGPHLHVAVVAATASLEQTTLPVIFNLGEKAAYLQAGFDYRRSGPGCTKG